MLSALQAQQAKENNLDSVDIQPILLIANMMELQMMIMINHGI